MSTSSSNSSNILSKAWNFVRENYKHPIRILAKAIYQYPLRVFVPDKFYLSVQFKANTGSRLDWKNPKSFNEKTQLLKLYDYKPWYSDISDKVEVRKYVSEKIGDQFLIPLVAVYNSVDEIEWD